MKLDERYLPSHVNPFITKCKKKEYKGLNTQVASISRL